jgi:polyisoprenoid-binding protein YceI
MGRCFLGSGFPSQLPVSVVMLVALSCSAQAADIDTAGAQATSTIRFVGSSSLHDWEGQVPPIRTALHDSALTGDWSGDLVIPVAALDTGNESRDARMREMFHADRWPEIRVAIRGVEPDVVARTRELVVPLTIGEVTHDVTTKITDWKRQGDRASFDVTARVSLESFGLEAPSVLGLVRVADEVNVQAHVDVVVSGQGEAGAGEPGQASVPR